MIERETIVGFFRNNRKRGLELKKRSMLWSFFFTDHDPAKLQALEHDPILEEEQLTFVGIREPGPNATGESAGIFYAELEHVAMYTIDELHQMCERLDAFAKRQGFDSFDGFDVGNIDGSVLYPR